MVILNITKPSIFRQTQMFQQTKTVTSNPHFAASSSTDSSFLPSLPLRLPGLRLLCRHRKIVLWQKMTIIMSTKIWFSVILLGKWQNPIICIRKFSDSVHKTCFKTSPWKASKASQASQASKAPGLQKLWHPSDQLRHFQDLPCHTQQLTDTIHLRFC